MFEELCDKKAKDGVEDMTLDLYYKDGWDSCGGLSRFSLNLSLTLMHLLH